MACMLPMSRSRPGSTRLYRRQRQHAITSCVALHVASPTLIAYTYIIATVCACLFAWVPLLCLGQQSSSNMPNLTDAQKSIVNKTACRFQTTPSFLLAWMVNASGDPILTGSAVLVIETESQMCWQMGKLLIHVRKITVDWPFTIKDPMKCMPLILDTRWTDACGTQQCIIDGWTKDISSIGATGSATYCRGTSEGFTMFVNEKFGARGDIQMANGIGMGSWIGSCALHCGHRHSHKITWFCPKNEPRTIGLMKYHDPQFTYDYVAYDGNGSLVNPNENGTVITFSAMTAQRPSDGDQWLQVIGNQYSVRTWQPKPSDCSDDCALVYNANESRYRAICRPVEYTMDCNTAGLASFSATWKQYSSARSWTKIGPWVPSRNIWPGGQLHNGALRILISGSAEVLSNTFGAFAACTPDSRSLLYEKNDCPEPDYLVATGPCAYEITSKDCALGRDWSNTSFRRWSVPDSNSTCNIELNAGASTVHVEMHTREKNCTFFPFDPATNVPAPNTPGANRTSVMDRIADFMKKYGAMIIAVIVVTLVVAILAYTGLLGPVLKAIAAGVALPFRLLLGLRKSRSQPKSSSSQPQQSPNPLAQTEMQSVTHGPNQASQPQPVSNVTINLNVPVRPADNKQTSVTLSSAEL
uniref:Glycoprotein n=1 Tax=Obscuromonas Qin-like virus TaxID=3157911 RepID=A0AAU7BN86_9VIRU